MFPSVRHYFEFNTKTPCRFVELCETVPVRDKGTGNFSPSAVAMTTDRSRTFGDAAIGRDPRF